MSMNDPLGDMLTRIRNAQMRGKSTVRTPASKLRAWVLDVLADERDPHTYDMCARHAERLSVPSGWHLDDRRPSRHLNLVAV